MYFSNSLLVSFFTLLIAKFHCRGNENNEVMTSTL